MQQDTEFLIDPFRALEEKFTEECKRANIFPMTTKAVTPAPLVGTIFGIAHRSGVGRSEHPIRVGLKRDDDEAMIVTELRVIYDNIQGDTWRYILRAVRRSVVIFGKDKEGERTRRIIPGRASEQIFFVDKTHFEEAARLLGARKRATEEDLQDRLYPEPFPIALERCDGYRVSVTRDDNQQTQMEFEKGTPLQIGVAKTLLRMRTLPLIENTTPAGENDRAFGPGDTPGSQDWAMDEAVRGHAKRYGQGPGSNS